MVSTLKDTLFLIIFGIRDYRHPSLFYPGRNHSPPEGGACLTHRNHLKRFLPDTGTIKQVVTCINPPDPK